MDIGELRSPFWYDFQDHSIFPNSFVKSIEPGFFPQLSETNIVVFYPSYSS